MSNEVIDLTDLPSDEEEDTTEDGAGFEQENEDEDSEPGVDDASYAQLIMAIETAPEARLRTILAKLVESSHTMQHVLFDELVTVPSEHRDNKRPRYELLAPRYEICAKCDEEFDVGEEREEGECMFHTGQPSRHSYMNTNPDIPIRGYGGGLHSMMMTPAVHTQITIPGAAVKQVEVQQVA
ncbi:hypothetical protein HWV62_4848 [Athelia sp. TMB]|nr:hypothetical protein HWV62_4848 [Athelia sp. TMB]